MSEENTEKVDLTKLTADEAAQLAVDNAIAAATDAGDPEPTEESKRHIFADTAAAHQMFLQGVAEAEANTPSQQAAKAEAEAAEEAHQAEIAKAAESAANTPPPTTMPGDEPIATDPDRDSK